jgi:hypothetical protein
VAWCAENEIISTQARVNVTARLSSISVGSGKKLESEMGVPHHYPKWGSETGSCATVDNFVAAKAPNFNKIQ